MRERGQATVELALALPVVATLALMVVQVGVLAHRQVLVAHAAREAARSAAVVERSSEVAQAARAGAERSGGLDSRRMAVQARVEDGLVQVEVSFADPTDVAIIGPLLPDVSLRASAAMRWEASD